MNVFHRIDSWLIEGPYQAVVDLSQRKPVWWARQSLVANLVMVCIRAAAFSTEQSWKGYLIPAICAACSAVIWITTHSPVAFAATGQQRFFRLFLVVMTVPLLLGLVVGDPARTLAGLLIHIAFMSFYYFAACKPPRPRVPRGRLAPGSAA